MSAKTLQSRSDTDLLEELSLLAVEKSVERRRQLLSSVADLFYAPGLDAHTVSERQIFASVVGRLLKDVTVAGRAEFSTRVARDDRTPRDVALALANDKIEVARPILSYSPVLSEGDLVAIASTKALEHRLAIAGRENITEKVTDSLLEHGELEVAESLTDNTTAAISQDAFSRLVEMASNRPSLSRKLSSREDMPLRTANDLLPYLSADDAAKLVALMGVEGAEELTSLLDRATPELIAQRGAQARRRINVRALLQDVSAGKRSLDEAMGHLTEAGQALDLALGLSLACELPEQQVANVIISVRSEPLAVICKALDILPAIYIAADGLRTASVNLPTVAPATLKAAYDKLTPDGAARSLRFVKVRNHVAVDPLAAN
ncbi:MAG: DUF2336 domain-containing protein [Devosia sp.]